MRSSRLLDRARFRLHSHASVKRKWRAEGCRANQRVKEEERKKKRRDRACDAQRQHLLAKALKRERVFPSSGTVAAFVCSLVVVEI